MKSGAKILVLRLSSIGDILLTTPYIRQIKNTFNDAIIYYIVKKEFADILKYNPNIDHLIELNTSKNYNGLAEINKELKKHNFDYIFDLHNNMRTKLLLAGLPKRKITKIKKNKLKRALLVYSKINLFKTINTIPEKYRTTGLSAGIPDDNQGLELYFPESFEQKITNLLNENRLLDSKYMCLAPGAAHYTKMWPNENYDLIIKRLKERTNFKMVILGSPNEQEQFDRFKSDDRVVNFTGKLSILESAGVVAHSKGVLCNDSGMMHVAAAVNKPLVVTFGSTVEELGFFPYKADSTVLEIKDLWCRPCSHVGRSSCPLGHFKCMTNISVDHVFEAINTNILN